MILNTDDNEELFDGAGEEEQEEQQEEQAEQQEDPDAKLAAMIATAVAGALDARGGQQQQQPAAGDDQDDDEDISYDPRTIAARATRDAAEVANMVDDLSEELRRDYPDLPADQLKSIKQTLRQQPLKELRKIVETKQHIALADSVYGRLVREKKIKPGKRSDEPFKGDPIGATSSPRDRGEKRQVIADFEKGFGKKPSAAARRMLMEEN